MIKLWEDNLKKHCKGYGEFGGMIYNLMEGLSDSVENCVEQGEIPEIDELVHEELYDFNITVGLMLNGGYKFLKKYGIGNEDDYLEDGLTRAIENFINNYIMTGEVVINIYFDKIEALDLGNKTLEDYVKRVVVFMLDNGINSSRDDIDNSVSDCLGNENLQAPMYYAVCGVIDKVFKD